MDKIAAMKSIVKRLKAKTDDNKYMLCESCETNETSGYAANPTCKNAVLFCEDRQGPTRWEQGNVVFTTCFLAQIARNGDPLDPIIKARIDAATLINDTTVSPTSTQLAQNYFDYMTFRARKEKQQHDLDLEFYEEQIKNGVSTFFGVYSENGKIVRDTQNPNALKEWRNKVRLLAKIENKKINSK